MIINKAIFAHFEESDFEVSIRNLIHVVHGSEVTDDERNEATDYIHNISKLADAALEKNWSGFEVLLAAVLEYDKKYGRSVTIIELRTIIYEHCARNGLSNYTNNEAMSCASGFTAAIQALLRLEEIESEISDYPNGRSKWWQEGWDDIDLAKQALEEDQGVSEAKTTLANMGFDVLVDTDTDGVPEAVLRKVITERIHATCDLVQQAHCQCALDRINVRRLLIHTKRIFENMFDILKEES